jgi:hypothetical protein
MAKTTMMAAALVAAFLLQACASAQKVETRTDEQGRVWYKCRKETSSSMGSITGPGMRQYRSVSTDVEYVESPLPCGQRPYVDVNVTSGNVWDALGIVARQVGRTITASPEVRGELEKRTAPRLVLRGAMVTTALDYLLGSTTWTYKLDDASIEVVPRGSRAQAGK